MDVRAFVSKAPLLRICLPLMLGIFVQWQLRDQYLLPLAVVRAQVAIALVAGLMIRHLRLASLVGLSFQIAICGMGAMIVQQGSDYFSDCHHLGADKAVLAFISSPPKIGDRFLRCQIELQGLQIGDSLAGSYAGKASLFLERDQRSEQLRYGDQLVLRARFDSLRAPANHYDFDFRAWQAYQNVFSQAFVKSDQWAATGIRCGSWLHRTSADFKQLLAMRVERYLSPAAQGIAMAMLLGDKSSLEQQTYQDYSAAGAMHVLAVSGLHVGFVAMLLGGLLTFLDRGRWRYLRLLLLISGLVFFACITGSTPSVMRATLMFSMLSIGIVLNRFSNSYNTLAFTAIMLLIFRPLDMMQAGFQLSFAAVLGIVSLQKPIASILTFTQPLMRWLWNVSSVSIAAQLGTLPIVIYYFHQIPSYSLITNCIVIPASAAILAIGLPIIVLPDWWLLVALKQLPAKLLSYLIETQNAALAQLSLLPGSTLSGMFIEPYAVALLYLLLFVLAHVWLKRSLNLTAIGICSIAVLLLIFPPNNSRHDQLVVHHHREFSLIEVQHSSESHFYYSAKDSSSYSKVMELRKSLEYDSWSMLQLPDQSGNSTYWNPPIFTFQDYRLLVVDSYSAKEALLEQSYNFLLVCDGMEIEDELLSRPTLSAVIVDGTNSYRSVLKLKKQCERLGVPIYETRSKGEFVLK